MSRTRLIGVGLVLSNETFPNHVVCLKRPQEMLKEDYKSAFFRCFLWQCFQGRKCNLAAHKYKNRSCTHLYVAKLHYLYVYVHYVYLDRCGDRSDRALDRLDRFGGRSDRARDRSDRARDRSDGARDRSKN